MTPDYPPGKYSVLLIGHQWVTLESVAALNNANLNRMMISTNFHNVDNILQTSCNTTLSAQKGMTADDVQEAFRRGAAQARQTAEKNGVKADSYQTAYNSVTELRHELTSIAEDGNMRISDIQKSKDLEAIKYTKIIDVVIDCQRKANQSAAKYGANIMDAGQKIFDAEGNGKSFRDFARTNGANTGVLFSQFDRKGIEEQVRNMPGGPGQVGGAGPGSVTGVDGGAAAGSAGGAPGAVRGVDGGAGAASAPAGGAGSAGRLPPGISWVRRVLSVLPARQPQGHPPPRPLRRLPLNKGARQGLMDRRHPSSCRGQRNRLPSHNREAR
jgi:hypothetical protein